MDEDIFDHKNVYMDKDGLNFKIGRKVNLLEVIEEVERYEKQERKQKLKDNFNQFKKYFQLKNLKSYTIYAIVATNTIFGTWLAINYCPGYAGSKAKAGELPINSSGKFIEGPYKNKSIDDVIYDKTKTYVCSILLKNQ